jgi:hypothetical protein
MLRRLIPIVAAAVLAIVPGAGAAEPAKPAFDGLIELTGTNGYHLSGLIVSANGIGQVTLFVGRAGEAATYTARGEGTTDSLDVDFGRLGKVDVEVRPTGKNETFPRECGGHKPVTVPATELVGSIEFHGEGGFTDATATNLPLRLAPLLNLICGHGLGVTTTSASHFRGVLLRAKKAGGPKLEIEQNHPGAPVFYEAAVHEKEGPVAVTRAVRGHLGAGALRFDPSLEAASFTGAAPFTGKATYSGRTPSIMASPGTGTWRGSLKVDFPGAAAVPIAGPGFKASVVHAHRTESR